MSFITYSISSSSHTSFRLPERLPVVLSLTLISVLISWLKLGFITCTVSPSRVASKFRSGAGVSATLILQLMEALSLWSLSIF